MVISIVTLAIVLISFLLVAGNIYFSFLKKSSVVVEALLGEDDLKTEIDSRPERKTPQKFNFIIPIQLDNRGDSPAAINLTGWEVVKPADLDIQSYWSGGDLYQILEPFSQKLNKLSVYIDIFGESENLPSERKLKSKMKALEEIVDKKEIKIIISYIACDIGIRHGFVKHEKLNIVLNPIIKRVCFKAE
ncbi:MAG: hypothetical protein HPY50_16785 [Firmicutes bacterium]|nr:hypothetical protein [Bacillota bacterium]